MHREYNKIQFRKQYRNIKNSDFDNKNIIGFDSETDKNGNIYLISDSKENYKFDLKMDIDQLLNFLTKHKYRKTLNLFYNIDFDFMAIIKKLPKKNIKELAKLEITEYKKYIIKWIPKKKFSIRIGKTYYHYFDLYQFYVMKLDNASKKYLNKSKNEIEISKLTHKDILNNKENIIKYCFHDCILVKELAELLQDEFSKLNIDFNNPMSIAFISSNYARQICDIPKCSQLDMTKWFYDCYYGGRFEIMKKGSFDKAYFYDIVSAYPYQIRNLLDLRFGYWHDFILNEIQEKDLKNYDIGVLEIELEFNKNYIYPLPIRANTGLITFPFINGKRKILLCEFLFMKKHNLLKKYKILNGYLFSAIRKIYPFRNFVDTLYNKKKNQSKEDIRYMIYKIMLNSLYGKFIQLTEIKEKCNCKNYDCIYEPFDYGNETYHKKIISGQLFNPIYASLITAKTRLQIIEPIIKEKEYKNLIGFHTDSIITLKEIKDKYLGNELGQLNYECFGQLTIIGTGIYSLNFVNGKKDFFTKLRGFKRKANILLYDLLINLENDLIPFERERSCKLKSCVVSDSIEDICRFLIFYKEININCDKKRHWKRQFNNGNDVIGNSIDSNPL